MIKNTNPFWYFKDNDNNENEKFINLNLVNFIKIAQYFDNTYDIEFHLPDDNVSCAIWKQAIMCILCGNQVRN